MKRVLLTGGTGQLGHALRETQWPEDMQIVAPERSNLDLSDAKSVADYLNVHSFDAIINAGAYTAVDKAEDDIETATTVNSLAPEILAFWSAEKNIPIIHVSTDYVFDGSKSEPYHEDDQPNPLGVYGQTKWKGEQAVAAANPRHVILRTSWVVSPVGQNFVKTMLRLARERDRVRVVNDQHGAPTLAADLAEAIVRIVLRQMADSNAPSGIYHFANAGETTWYRVAREVFRLAKLAGHMVPLVEDITTAEYPTRAVRPANSRLDTGKIARDFDIHPRHWTAALDSLMKQLLTQGRGEAQS
ncbi:MAG: dTDP-4-dehydrorhamnose reductase [Beijerinckiaceae bacterium]